MDSAVTKLVTGARVARPLPNSRATYLVPILGSGHVPVTFLPLLPGPDRPPPRQQKGSSQAVAVEKTKETLSARCALSLSLSLSLSLRVRFLAFFRFHIIIAFPMRVVHACHTVDCELVVGLIVWCQVLVQFSVHWRQLCVLWLLAGERGWSNKKKSRRASGRFEAGDGMRLIKFLRSFWS